jgi:hypothetical protein
MRKGHLREHHSRTRICDSCGLYLEPPGSVVIRSRWISAMTLRFCSFDCLRKAINDKNNPVVSEFERLVDRPYDEK